MFESFYADPHESHIKNKHKHLQNLLTRYSEIQKRNSLSRQPLSEKQKRAISKSHTRRKVFKILHQRLQQHITKPEETYEIWADKENINTNITGRRVDTNICNILNSIEEEEKDEDQESVPLRAQVNEHNEQEEDHIEDLDQEIYKFTDSFSTDSNWTRKTFVAKINGLETFYDTPNTYTKYHLNNLKILLHINILRRKWNLAYKIYCLIIRIPSVDIRNIWPLGIEILKHIDIDSAFMRDEKFLEWLANFFTISKSASNSKRMISAPIWRSGSKYHAPLYVTTLLWLLLIRKKYSKLLEKLEELLLEPPYSNEGIFYYLSALCILGQALEKKTLTTQDTTYVEKALEKCKELNFYFPKQHMIDLMKNFNQDDKVNSVLNKVSENSSEAEEYFSIGDSNFGMIDSEDEN